MLLPRILTPSLAPTPHRISPPPPSSRRHVLHLVPTARQATPCWLDFGDTPAQQIPRVPCVSPPAKSCPLPALPAALPIHEPISHCTRSHSQAPLALFTSGQPYHEQVKYHIPTAKSTQPVNEPLAFAGLCEAFDMKQAEVKGFAFLCDEALTLEDRPGLLALLVLNPAIGKFLKHRQLHHNNWYKATWDTSYDNVLGRLCQGSGAGSTSTSQRVSGTNTFFLIDYQDIPMHKWKEICHTMVVCEVHPDKDDPDCTRITIGGNCICFPGNVGTNTALLELVKLRLNSILS